eukprot:6456931-Amphidinium_carterae.2
MPAATPMVSAAWPLGCKRQELQDSRTTGSFMMCATTTTVHSTNFLPAGMPEKRRNCANF